MGFPNDFIKSSLNALQSSIGAVQSGLSNLQSVVSGIVSGVSSVHGRAGAVTAQSGDYNPTLVGLGNVTNDEQAKALISGYTEKTSLVGSDLIYIGDSAAAFALKKSTLNSLSAFQYPIRYPNEAAILAQLAPLHWWNANHTVESGGLVDTLVDIGTAPKDFSQVGAARAAVAADGNGQNYLNFAGSQYYRAGVASDWTFANNGTPCTFAYILSRPALATTAEVIAGTAASDTTKVGFDLWWGYLSATDQGPSIIVVRGTLNQYVLCIESSFLGTNIVAAVIFRTHGHTPPVRTANGATTYPIGGTMEISGQQRAWGPRNAAYNTATAQNPLTLGRRPDLAAGQFLNARLYDVLIHDDAWSDAQCQLWFQYARIRQGLAPEFGWPVTLTP